MSTPERQQDQDPEKHGGYGGTGVGESAPSRDDDDRGNEEEEDPRDHTAAGER